MFWLSVKLSLVKTFEIVLMLIEMLIQIFSKGVAPFIILPGFLYPAESDTFSDGQTQRGMDRYLDSLFDPVLSDDGVVSVHTDDLQATQINSLSSLEP